MSSQRKIIPEIGFIFSLNELIAGLSMRIRNTMAKFPDLRERFIIKDLSEDHANALLNETVTRLFWNTINKDKKFKWECWDEDGMIAEWFKGYTLFESGDTFDDIHPIDPDSYIIFDEIIDPIIIDIRRRIRVENIQNNSEFDVIEIVSVNRGFLALKNKGDFRIIDWYRLKDEYERNENNGLLSRL